jgi:two-component system sensor histidine kinase KdpD
VALLRDCAGDLRNWAEQDGHRIEVDLPQDMPPLLLDYRLIERVVINLLSNGIKHTPLGTTITLGARVDDSGPRIWVHDDGPGIPTGQQRGLFDRFSATADHGSRQANTGLGLAFCKLAVEAHNGSISAHSAPGQGTTFTVALPIETLGTELDAGVAAVQTDVEQYEPA